jgi:superfamily II DNA or RNA helicase
LHAVLAHWTVSHDPATVVMPTGTGKTETMMAILVAERLERVY